MAGDEEMGCAEPVCEATGRVPAHQILKQGVLLSQPYLMLQAACFHGQGLERCCSRKVYPPSASQLRSIVLLSSLLYGKGIKSLRV